MAIGREAIYSALFTQLQNALLVANGGPFNFMSRRYSVPGALAAEQYPALMLVERGESYERKVIFTPAKVLMYAHVIIQSAIGADTEVVPATEINNLADKVEDAVEMSWSGAKTPLMNLVQIGRINGREVQVIASSAALFSEQDMEIEMMLPHAY